MKKKKNFVAKIYLDLRCRVFLIHMEDFSANLIRDKVVLIELNLLEESKAIRMMRIEKQNSFQPICDGKVFKRLYERSK